MGVGRAFTSTTVSAEAWHRRLGHPAEPAMRRVMNKPETRVNFTGSLSSCDTCMINKSTQKNHPKISESTSVTGRLQLVTADLLGPVTPTALGGYQ